MCEGYVWGVWRVCLRGRQEGVKGLGVYERKKKCLGGREKKEGF